MKWFTGGITFVNTATIIGLILGVVGGGLNPSFAGLALLLAFAAAIWAWSGSSTFYPRKVIAAAPAAPLPKSKRARRRMKLAVEAPPPPDGKRRWDLVWAWVVGIAFLMFAIRSFCWVLWVDGNNLKIQSPNNLGDLALHITYIKYFANGVPLWPDNPIHAFSKLRYPAGIDFFDSLLLLQHIDLVRALVWTGLLGSVATFYAFYRWGGAFGVAGFLFNGGLAGFEFLHNWTFSDYSETRIAWKSIPLTMFVTQRGLLYAIPAGLLLLLHWRRKYFPIAGDESLPRYRGLVPWWVEWSVYAVMPFFHVHTFLALSGVLAFWLVIGDWEMRKQIALLLIAAFLPATWIVWMITDHFQAKSILGWAPGWLQSDPAFSTSGYGFWLTNFGLTLPAMIVLVAVLWWRLLRRPKPETTPEASTSEAEPNEAKTSLIRLIQERLGPSAGQAFAFVTPGAAIFIFALFVKTAPWSWDNMKLLVWAYFLFLPFLWRELIAKWPIPVRGGVCFLLFFSGFVSLIAGLEVGIPGYDIANRTELNSIALAVDKIPIGERFAAFPIYNHPLLMDGRKMVLGYPGHLWTQGFDYGTIENQLRALMMGLPAWQKIAQDLHARYLFWGNQEKQAYGSSSQPWRDKVAVVASGPWGTIYDLQTPATPGGQ